MEKINLIFDCDGTLINSYPAIIEQMYNLFLLNGVDCDRDYIRELCLYHDSRYCIKVICDKYGTDYDKMMAQRKTVNEDIYMITLYDYAEELLKDDRFNCFVYTHRGSNCHDIFRNLKIEDYFIEIVDASYGFKRKPEAQAIDYLVEKYQMDKKNTYYVGDRSLDVECGINGGIKTIFFNSAELDIDSSKADFTVESLKEILSLDFKKRRYHFQKALSAEKEEICSLYKSVIGTQYCVWNEYYPCIDDIENDLATDNLFVLKDDDKIIGAISIVNENEMDDFNCWKIKENVAEFARVVISPDYQNNHLSQLLVTGIIEEMKKRNIKAVHISIAIKNIPATRLYKSAGFEYLMETEMYGNSYWLAEKEI